jgi:chromosome segregation ATPase
MIKDMASIWLDNNEAMKYRTQLEEQLTEKALELDHLKEQNRNLDAKVRETHFEAQKHVQKLQEFTTQMDMFKRNQAQYRVIEEAHQQAQEQNTALTRDLARVSSNLENPTRQYEMLTAVVEHHRAKILEFNSRRSQLQQKCHELSAKLCKQESDCVLQLKQKDAGIHRLQQQLLQLQQSPSVIAPDCLQEYDELILQRALETTRKFACSLPTSDAEEYWKEVMPYCR